ncbi:MAG: Asp-tRNA(Asn)/Glu-tRNA(Gln) amidotransferase subunit GatA [Patescibacteria group bacterium]
MINLQTLTIQEAREGLKRKDFSARELTQACLDVIEKKDKDIHAFLEIFEDALTQADEADNKLKNLKTSELPNLLGIPIALKDNILVKGKHASAGSKILENYVATYDSTATKKLKEAGAVIVGRTNMDEFAMGSSTENSAFGPTKNPFDTTRVPGGSSGGSAAAVAAGMVLGAFGSDTGGSIRQPAAFTGVVGFKPTYGRVSRFGLIALGSSLDQIGPFAKTVTDAEILYDAVKGEDLFDSTTIDLTPSASHPPLSLPRRGERGEVYVIGVPRKFIDSEGVSKEVKENFEQTLEKFKKLGYKVQDIELKYAKHSLAAYYIIMPAEASSNLTRFDGVKYGLHVSGQDSIDDYFKTRGAGFGREARRRIILGTYVLSSGYYDEYYGSALKAKRLITDEYRKTFEDVDIILTPTTPTPAFKIGEKSSDPLSMYLADIFTVTANIVGLPSVSLPSGFAELDGVRLPLGVELTADLRREDILFAVGKEFLGE